MFEAFKFEKMQNFLCVLLVKQFVMESIAFPTLFNADPGLTVRLLQCDPVAFTKSTDSLGSGRQDLKLRFSTFLVEVGALATGKPNDSGNRTRFEP